MLTRVLLLSFCLAAPFAWAKPPRLTVFVSVDAMGSDVFLRNQSNFKGGLAKLVKEGAFFPYARYDYAECVTAAGHSTLMTGAVPAVHSVNSNKVFNRKTGKLEKVFFDADFPLIETTTTPTDDSSPRRLLAETLADRLKMATYQKGTVISVAGKGRSAIAMAGHLGKAWWFHPRAGKFLSSTYYETALSSWVAQFNQLKRPESFLGKNWELMMAPRSYQGTDGSPNEEEYQGLGRAFPHPLKGKEQTANHSYFLAFESTPLMNDVVIAFATTALEANAMGQDEVPDALFVGLSATDHIYHHFGPYSWEMQDALLRLDQSLTMLMTAAEKAAGGKEHVLLVLTADHGGSAIPEEWAKAGLDASRVYEPEFLEKLNQELEKEWKIPKLILALEEIDAYLNETAIAEKKLDAPLVRRSVAKALSRQPGIRLALAQEDLFAIGTDEAIRHSLRQSFHPLRSGDVLFVTNQHVVLSDERFGASHGTPYAYDSQVPLVFWGKGVQPGMYPSEVKTTSIAPTVAAFLEMGAPAQSTSSALSEAIAPKKR